MSKTTITSKVDQDVHDRLDVLAERLGWTKSDLIAHCVAYGLREGEKFADRVEGPVLGHLMRLVFMLDADDPDARQAFDQVHASVTANAKRRKQMKKGVTT